MKEILQHIVDDLSPDEKEERVLTEEEFSFVQNICEGILTVMEGNSKYVLISDEFAITRKETLRDMEAKDFQDEHAKEVKANLEKLQKIKAIIEEPSHE